MCGYGSFSTDVLVFSSFVICFTLLLGLLSTHADRQGVDISVTVCLCVFCNFVRLRISPPRVRLRLTLHIHIYGVTQELAYFGHWIAMLPHPFKSNLTPVDIIVMLNGVLCDAKR